MNIVSPEHADPSSSTSADPAQPVLSEEERRQLLIEWNATSASFSRDLCIHQLFEAQVERAPHAVAARCRGEEWSYQELNARANALAHHLKDLGVGPGVRVAVYMERSLDMLLAVMGILKAGGAYVPLEPSFPQARVQWILSSLSIPVLITHQAHLPSLPAARLLPALRHFICLDVSTELEQPAEDQPTAVDHKGLPLRNPASLAPTLWTRLHLRGLPEENLPLSATPQDLAYILFTSGSTGTPKGVMIRHQSVVNLVEWVNKTFGIQACDRALFVTSVCFDLSVYDLFGLLAAGGSIAIATEEDLRDPERLLSLLRSEPITFWNSAPAALQQLVPVLPTTPGAPGTERLRLIFLSGDWIPVRLPDTIRHVFTRAQVVNLGGPTETTIWSNYYPIGVVAPAWTSIPYGRPIQNVRCYILDADLHPCPVGVTGDLYTGGVGLAIGYINEPMLTAEKFLPDPFSGEVGARLYKTGDLARFWPDGNVEFLGRADAQVKVRGFRIELGEVETTLSQHPAIQEAVVAAREYAEREKRLVAYLVPNPQQALWSKAALVNDVRRFLKERLPEYMLPSAYVLLEAIPLTRNGKVDRKALPEPAWDPAGEGQDIALPRTELEETLAALWAEALGIQRVGVNDNFFELGGHSLLATQVVVRVREHYQVDLPLPSLFQAPTIASFARVVEAQQESASDQGVFRIQPVERQGTHHPLSFPQEQVWFLLQLDPQNRAYQFQATLKIGGPLNISVLERSLSEIIRRHEIFRTTFEAIEGQPMQLIHAPWSVQLPVIDLRALPQQERDAEVERALQDEFRKPFALDRLPLIRWSLLRLAEQEYLLTHVEHHLVHDGWSFNTFLHELSALYQAFSRNQPSPLPELPIQFVDFVYWQRQWVEGEIARTQLAYWAERLRGSPPLLELPTDHPRPAVQTSRGNVLRVDLPPDLCAALRARCRQEGATLFMVMLSTFLTLLYRYTGQEDFCIGTGVANRRSREAEQLIGMIINTLVLRADLAGNPTFRELLDRVRALTLEAYAHQDLPFEKIVQALRPERNLSYNPFFQVMFGFHDSPLDALELPSLNLELTEALSNGSAKFDLNLIVIPRAEQAIGLGLGQQSEVQRKARSADITLVWEYNSDLFELSTAQRMVNAYQVLLRLICADPQQRIAELPVLTAAEYRQQLVEWNATRTAYPADRCIHQVFEALAEQYPQAPAVLFGDNCLSYSQLNRQANQLAHYLRELDINSGDPVGLYMERSADLVIAILAILKAGAAYVPLDLAYPRERIAFMVRDTQMKAVLTHEALRAHFPAQALRVVAIDGERGHFAQKSQANLLCTVQPQDLALVLYTSGSTGAPKGVALPHRGVNRLVCATNYIQIGPADRVAQASNTSFDAATLEIWGALLNGAQLIGVPREVALSPQDLAAFLRERQVSILFLTTALLNQVAREAPEAVNGLRYLLFGGEAADPRWVRTILERGHPQRLLNLYGPTENTTLSTWYAVEHVPAEAGTVPIGYPVANSEVYVLDRWMQPVPVGLPGELYVGGAGLARGYLYRPELTAERFVPHPFSTEPGARLYKTGDLVRALSDGALEFIGRRDSQIKLRGFRVELGEIEALLRQHPSVQDALVLLRTSPEGEKRLVGYIVPRPAATLSPQEVHRFLKQQLPEYMLPTSLICLEAFPLTPNGKIDSNALSAQEQAAPSELPATPYAPRTPLEQSLGEIWVEMLGLSQVDPHANFFELGGHSLLATRFVAHLRARLQIDLALRVFFEHPTLAELAAIIESGAYRETLSPMLAISPIPRRITAHSREHV